MIVEALFTIIGAALEVLLAPLDALELPLVAEAFNAVGLVLGSVPEFWSVLSWLDFYLPVADVFAVIAFIGAAFMASVLWDLTVWVLSKLHIGGGGSQ